MAYCTLADILKMIPQVELAELTAESGDTPDDLVVAEAIAQAGAEIDSYLGVRYTVPLAPAPDLVKTLAVDLALYHLYARRSLTPPVRLQKYQAAVGFLQQVAAGLAVVTGAGGAEPPSRQREVAEMESEERTCSRTTLGEW